MYLRDGCKSNEKSFHDADDGYSSFQRTQKKKSELDVAESSYQETDRKMHSMSTLQPPAGHERFRCRCGQLMRNPYMIERVRCPQCRGVLAPPPGLQDSDVLAELC